MNTEDIERIKRFAEMQNTKLHDDLVPHIRKGKSFPVLHHPLVVYAPYHEGLAYYANQQYEHKTKAIEECKEEKNWSQYIWLHERPYRLEAFLDIRGELNPEDYWKFLAHAWIDTEFPHVNLPVWKTLFNEKLPQRDVFMCEEDKEVYDNLPHVVTVYRGYENPKHRSGISHTLDLEKAEWFSKRFGKQGGVVMADVPKEKVLFYTNQRGEKEIIITSRIKYKTL